MYLYSIARHGRRRWRQRRWTFAWRRRKSKIKLGRLRLRLQRKLGQQNLIFFDPKNGPFVRPQKWGHEARHVMARY